MHKEDSKRKYHTLISEIMYKEKLELESNMNTILQLKCFVYIGVQSMSKIASFFSYRTLKKFKAQITNKKLVVLMALYIS